MDGAAFFDFVDGMSNRVKRRITMADVRGRRVVLLIGTSILSHIRLSDDGFGFFADVGGPQTRPVRYPQYKMTYLLSDDQKTLLLQFGLAGVHTRYGSNPRNARMLERLVRETFEFERGVRIDYLAVQLGTNDLKNVLDASATIDVRPETDEVLFEEIMADCKEMHEVFRPKVGTIILGLGTPKWRNEPKNEERNEDEKLAAKAIVTNLPLEKQHHVLHKCGLWMEKLAARDVERLKADEIFNIVHSPLLMLPSSACVAISENFGHLKQSSYGDLAMNTVNAIRNGIRMLDPSYQCPLLRCHGIPPSFTKDYERVRLAVHPGDRHHHGHEGRELCRDSIKSFRAPVHTSDRDKGTWYSLMEGRIAGDLVWTFW